MNSYATLAQLRRALGLGAAQTSEDDRLLLLLGAAARLIEGFTGRQFYPLRATRCYGAVPATRLLLDADLLALHSLTNGDGTVIPLDACTLVPLNAAVKSGVVLDPAQAVFVRPDGPADLVRVEGTWGCHPGWAEAWEDSADAVQDAPLAADAALIAVSDVEGPDAGGRVPRFAAGQLIALEDEYLHVLAVDRGANTLAVRRGANGTTAALHAAQTPIRVYQPPEDVRQVCLRIACWLYKQQDAGFVQAAGGLRGQVIVPPALPEDVQQILAPYVWVQVA